MLLVPPNAMQAFPEYVTVAGESVPVVVQRTFKPPVPLPLKTRPGEGG
jgi:hypothetical protein